MKFFNLLKKNHNSFRIYIIKELTLYIITWLWEAHVFDNNFFLILFNLIKLIGKLLVEQIINK